MERKKHIYTEQEAYLKLSALCAMSEQCCHDVLQKMKRWEVADAVAEKVVARLVKERFIDEERFAKAFVRDKFRYNHWGKVRIVQELKTVKGRNEYEIRGKLIRFALGKGFQMDDIVKVVGSLEEV